jgi:hypothetical protein
MKHLVNTVVLGTALTTTVVAAPLDVGAFNVNNSNIGDASVWINQGIRDAIARGQSEYVIPAGVYDVRDNIVLPPGTRNFTLRGAGSQATVFTTRSRVMDQIIEIGTQTPIHNNWGISNRPTQNVRPVTSGSVFVTLQNSANIEPGWYALWDDYAVVASKPPHERQMNRLELVEVISYDANRRRARLRQGVGRDYRVNPKLSDMRNALTHNITVRGFGMVGSVNESTQASDGIVQAGLTVGLRLDDLRVRTFGHRAILLNAVRDALVTNTDVADAVDRSIGRGYGLTMHRCRFVTVTDSIATNTRHAFVGHAGTMDVHWERLQARGPDNNLDTHGFDERRFTIVNSFGEGGVLIGNPNWLGGARDIVIRNCTFLDYVVVNPNVRGVRVINSVVGRLMYNSARGNTGTPNMGYADSITFQDTTFRYPSDMIYEAPEGGSFTFTRCRFEQTRQTWGSVARLNETNARFTFNNSLFVSRSTRSQDVPIIVSTPQRSFRLTIRDSRLKTSAAAVNAVRANELVTGTISIRGNRFASTHRGQLRFLDNRSTRARVTDTANTTEGQQTIPPALDQIP